jgi:hypothetical protein
MIAADLARLDARLFIWRRWRDDFLLVPGLRVWGLGVDVLIACRRRRNHLLILGLRRYRLFPIVGSGWILTLGTVFSGVSVAPANETSKAEDVTRANVDHSITVARTPHSRSPRRRTKTSVLSFQSSFGHSSPAFSAQDAATGVTLVALPTECGYEPTLVADPAA